MRSHLLACLLLVAGAAPAAAQTDRAAQRRIEKLEQELRAVQRRVFPNGATVSPEITASTPAATTSGVPASSAVADLNARLDAVEGQLRALTGQTEETANRARQLGDALTAAQARIEALEQRPAAAAIPETNAVIAEPATTRPATTDEPTRPTSSAGSSTDGAEAAYNAGFRLWEQQRYGDAQRALEAMAAQHPRHRLASWARNLAGRAYLDDNKPEAAAKIFLANYQTNPQGERAADSLYFLGQTLARLNKKPEACKAYDELRDFYGDKVRDYLKQRLPAARKAANCTD